MEPLKVNEKDARINMQTIFDGDRSPHKKIGSGSTEVVKKLSFQLGCQSQDEDMQITRNILLDQANAPAVAQPVEIIANHIDRSDNDEVHITPLPRHQYNRNMLVLNNQIDKDDLERENEMIYDSLRSRRRYQLWRGNNVFICYGRLMLGVHIGHLTLSISLITGQSQFNTSICTGITLHRTKFKLFVYFY